MHVSGAPFRVGYIISEQLIAPIATLYMTQIYYILYQNEAKNFNFLIDLKTDFFSHFGYYLKENIYAQRSLFLEQVTYVPTVN